MIKTKKEEKKMCIVSNKPVQVAKSPIKVWKVFELKDGKIVCPYRFLAHVSFKQNGVKKDMFLPTGWCEPLRTILWAQGITSVDNFSGEILEDQLPITLEQVTRYPAVGFDRGFGYCCFPTENRAYIYKNEKMGKSSSCIVLGMLIPEGVKYQEGLIDKPFIGEGLIAVRAESLILR